MKLKRRTKTGFSESSAASDIAFLLIIYFIVIAGFNINKGFLINLPSKDSTRLIVREDLLRFEMDREGGIVYESEIIGLSEAKELITLAHGINPNISVIVTIDKAAPWQRVVSFVELAQDCKIDSFSFAMKKDTL
jgi:biopolymer transport protein ExbD